MYVNSFICTKLLSQNWKKKNLSDRKMKSSKVAINTWMCLRQSVKPSASIVTTSRCCSSSAVSARRNLSSLSASVTCRTDTRRRKNVRRTRSVYDFVSKWFIAKWINEQSEDDVFTCSFKISYLHSALPHRHRHVNAQSSP